MTASLGQILTDKVNEPDRIILASGSPRRKELMANAGYRFEVIIPHCSVEESINRSLTPIEFVREAAYRKAEAIAKEINASAIVIAADTVASCDKEILGKPRDRVDAKRMLKLMSGRLHDVYTGVSIWHRPSNRHITHVETTQLQMKNLQHDKLEAHLDSGDWVGKAGAFGFQDGLDWVSVVSGLESNVVGLPIEILSELIEQVTQS